MAAPITAIAGRAFHQLVPCLPALAGTDIAEPPPAGSGWAEAIADALGAPALAMDPGELADAGVASAEAEVVALLVGVAFADALGVAVGVTSTV